MKIMLRLMLVIPVFLCSKSIHAQSGKVIIEIFSGLDSSFLENVSVSSPTGAITSLSDGEGRVILENMSEDQEIFFEKPGFHPQTILYSDLIKVGGKSKIFLFPSDNLRDKAQTAISQPAKSAISEPKQSKMLIDSHQLDDYSGFRIVIGFSRFTVNEDSPVRKNHSDVIEYKTEMGNYLYLLGDFLTENEAQEYLELHLKNSYPTAYVVGFEKGKRIK